MLRLDLALGDAGGERDRVLHRLHLLGELALVVRARLADEASRIGDDVRGGAALDRADVRGRLLVDRARAASPRWPARRRRSRSGPPPGTCRRGRRGRGSVTSSSCATARRGSRRRPARPGRRRSPIRARSRVWSNAYAPSRPVSSFEGEEQLDPGVRAALGQHAADGLEHGGDGGLVVAAEDLAAAVADDAVLDHRLDRVDGRHGVEVGAEEERLARRASARARRGCSPSSSRSRGRCRPRRASARGRGGTEHAIGDGALLTRRAGERPRAPGRGRGPRMPRAPIVEGGCDGAVDKV